MFGIGTQELLIVFMIVLLLFGANRIPEIGRAMGKGIRDFKKATRELEDEFKPGDVSDHSTKSEQTASPQGDSKQ